MLLMQNVTIKHKLVLIIMATCIAALLLAGMAFIAWGQTSFRRSMVRNLSIQAEMIAENCKAALAFEDVRDAEDTLRSLRVESSVVFGCVYTNSGEIFASYYRDDVDSSVQPSELRKGGYSFGDGLLTVFKPIVLDDETMGTLCLRSDLRAVHVMLKRNISITIAVLLLASLVAYFVSSRLQKVISGPILSLADVAKVVSEQKDYSTRAVKCSNDEVGLLIDAFNQMLEQIQRRDTALVDAKEQLETRVRERTNELRVANEQLTIDIAERKRTEEELARKRRNLEALFDVAPVGMLLVDENMIVKRANSTISQMVCREYSQIVNQRGGGALGCINSTYNEKGCGYSPVCGVCSLRKAIRSVLDSDQSVHGVEIHPTLKVDNKEVTPWLCVSAEPVMIDGRKHVIIAVDDITNRKRAEEAVVHEQNLLRSLMNNIPDSIYFKDIESHFIRVNKGLADWHGVSDPAEVVGKTDFDFFTEQHARKAYADEQRILETGQPLVDIEEKETWPDGRVTWVSTTKMPLRDEDGRIIGTFGISRDITERNLVKQKLEQTVLELKRSNDDLQQFASVASHDLQEPLRMITSYLQLLAKRYKNKLDEDADEFISFAVDGAKRMQGLINDLLAYSRVGTHGKPFESCDCESILTKVLRDLDRIIEENNAVVTHDPLPTMVVDATQLEQVFRNLISNAIKYRRKDQAPHIHISAEQKNNEWLFSVQDNGIGIEPKFSERIFAIFQQLHGRSEYDGSGIGLAICKRVVERHGGRIWVESEPGEGSTFFFTFPKHERGVKDTKLEEVGTVG